MAAALNGSGTGLVVATLGVLVGERFGLTAVGAVFAGGVVARLVVLGLARLLRRGRAFGSPQQRFALLVVAMVLSAVAAVVAAAVAPLYVVFVTSVVSTGLNVAVTTLHSHHGRRHLVTLGPIAMVGTASGAVFASVMLSWGGVGLIGVGAALLLQLGQISAMGRYGMTACSSGSTSSTFLPMVSGFGLALFCYGPLASYAALVVEVSSVRWVGVAMAAYAAGALAAPRLHRHFRNGVREPMIFLLGACGVGTWMLALNGPMAVGGRFVSGVLLFTSQGALLMRVAARDPSAGGLLAVSTGLGLGAGVGGLMAGWLADTFSVPVMGAVLMSGALTAAGVIHPATSRVRSVVPAGR